MTEPSKLSLERIREGSVRHLAEYLETNGERGSIYRGAPILILTTTGRTSGEPRSTPLIFGRDADSFIVVASLGGADHHPGWYRNLQAHPVADVQVMADRFHVRARTAGPDERPRVWELMVCVYPAYAEYQERTDREIPVVVLDQEA
jgi:deazaflavin-dependent oxidoreductase (nitroreductase family)